jgi:hypothetical protein
MSSPLEPLTVALHSMTMGSWYTIGLSLGVGVGAGVLAAGLLARSRAGIVLAAVLGGFVGAAVGFAVGGTPEIVAGAVGGPLGAGGASPVVLGALKRGGTRAGTAVFVAAAGLVVAGLSLLPALGYVAAVAVPAVGIRLRRRAPERYAGLRTLAK